MALIKFENVRPNRFTVALLKNHKAAEFHLMLFSSMEKESPANLPRVKHT